MGFHNINIVLSQHECPSAGTASAVAVCACVRLCTSTSETQCEMVGSNWTHCIHGGHCRQALTSRNLPRYNWSMEILRDKIERFYLHKLASIHQLHFIYIRRTKCKNSQVGESFQVILLGQWSPTSRSRSPSRSLKSSLPIPKHSFFCWKGVFNCEISSEAEDAQLHTV